jgi:hypothetical protein
MNIVDSINEIRHHHRRRRFAMKIQQKLDRALESFLRINATNWSPDMPSAEREKINNEVRAMIKRVRAGEDSPFRDVVAITDDARKPADKLRAESEKTMEQLAQNLPVIDWIEGVRGAGALGLATIVAEAGNLTHYPNPAKLWSRLGFAPYDGCAGSTWKRETWRPRKLTSEEWTDHPFSGERYALMHQIAVWLVNAQWIGKAKSESGEGAPNGTYGQVYFDRRKHTEITHPEWTDGHRRMDGLRKAMKEFLKDLYLEWFRQVGTPKNDHARHPHRKPKIESNADARSAVKPNQPVRPREPRQKDVEAQVESARLPSSPKADASTAVKSKAPLRPREPRHAPDETQASTARLPNSPKADASRAMKPKTSMRPRDPRQSSSVTQEEHARVPHSPNGKIKHT